MKDTRACKTWQALAGVALGVCVWGGGVSFYPESKVLREELGEGDP